MNLQEPLATGMIDELAAKLRAVTAQRDRAVYAISGIRGMAKVSQLPEFLFRDGIVSICDEVLKNAMGN